RNVIVFRTQGVSKRATCLVSTGAADSLLDRLILNYDNFVVKSAGEALAKVAVRVKNGSRSLLARFVLGNPAAHNCRADVRGIDMGEIVSAEIGDGQLAEDVVEDRGCVLDRLVALHQARGL